MGRDGKTRIHNFSGQLELQLPCSLWLPVFRGRAHGLTRGPWLLVRLGS